jgi:hypothetical protein
LHFDSLCVQAFLLTYNLPHSDVYHSSKQKVPLPGVDPDAFVHVINSLKNIFIIKQSGSGKGFVDLSRSPLFNV